MSLGPLAFDAPWALWLLPTPILLAWWFARARGARQEPTGSVEVWREAVRDVPRAARRAWRWPARTVAAVAALLCAVLALSQPAHRPAGDAVKWIAIYDASSPMSRGAGADSWNGVSAVGSAERMLGRISRENDSVEWRLVSGSQVIASSSAPPLDEEVRNHLARSGLPPPEWSRFDEAGVIWVTYDAEGLAPKRAGVVASIPSIRADSYASWPGASLTRPIEGDTRLVEERTPRAAMRAEEWNSEIGRLVAAWAKARGVEAANYDAFDEWEVFELVVALAAESGGESARGSRDGWTLSGPIGTLTPTRWPATTWLSDSADASRALVRVERGRIDVAFTARHELSGDADAFAVSWSERLDRALLPTRAVYPLPALIARSEAVEIPPQRPLPAGGEDAPLAHVLAAAASALALLAAFLRG